MPTRTRVAAALIALPLMLWPAMASAQASVHTLGNWNLAEQRQVVADHLMGLEADGQFDGQLPLSAVDMQAILAALAKRPGLAPVASWSDLTVAGFDRLLVDVLGLGTVASHVQAVAATAGLAPPSYFGSEVAARNLGLRYNHPAAEDALELYPTDTITRAEAAHSLAVLASLPSWALSGTRTLLSAFALPAYTPTQLAPLALAVSKIGMPYVWGGVSDTATTTQVHGGYDCSGLIWRVYRLSGNSAGQQIGGRTAAQMAGEISTTARIPLNAVQPGDLLFFGTAGFSGRATEASITHAAIALSPQWAIESSGQGVNVAPLQSGWLNTSFAWARRILTGSTATVATATPVKAAPKVGKPRTSSTHRVVTTRRHRVVTTHRRPSSPPKSTHSTGSTSHSDSRAVGVTGGSGEPSSGTASASGGASAPS